MHRSRHVVAQNEQFGDPPRTDDIAINFPIRFKRADAAQHRAPLVVIGGAADFFGAGQQNVILGVEYARGIVGAFDVGAEAQKMKRLVMQHGAESDPAK